MSELAQIRWFVWFLCFLAFAARPDVTMKGVSIGFAVWLFLGAVTHFAWWITKPKDKKQP